MPLALPPLPYPVEALEPHLSRATLETHRGYHPACVARCNRLLVGSDLSDRPLAEIVLAAYRNQDRRLFDIAAQVWNHEFYWHSLRPGGGGRPAGTVARLIDRDLDGYTGFVEQLRAAASGQPGGGWVWLVLAGSTLRVTTTANADTPLVYAQVPLLCVDLSEHAYFPDYRQPGEDYLTTVIESLLDWAFANTNLHAAPAEPLQLPVARCA